VSTEQAVQLLAGNIVRPQFVRGFVDILLEFAATGTRVIDERSVTEARWVITKLHQTRTAQMQASNASSFDLARLTEARDTLLALGTERKK
jgi:hypothetical protein